MTRSDWRIGMVGSGLWAPDGRQSAPAGLRLQVHTRSRRAENDPQLAGTKGLHQPSRYRENVDILLLCVSDDTAVNDVLFGQDGATEQLQPGSTWSTALPSAPWGATDRCTTTKDRSALP